MNTKRITTEIAQAADAIRAGQLVAVPTETVYGLAGNGLDPAAVAQIYEIKGRPAGALLRRCAAGGIHAGRGVLARPAHDRAAGTGLRARDRARGWADRRPALPGSPGHAGAHRGRAAAAGRAVGQSLRRAEPENGRRCAGVFQWADRGRHRRRALRYRPGVHARRSLAHAVPHSALRRRAGRCRLGRARAENAHCRHHGRHGLRENDRAHGAGATRCITSCWRPIPPCSRRSMPVFRVQ